MRIEIRTIPHGRQRYDTCGDYFLDEDGVLQLRVSNARDWRSEAAVIVHELVEYFLCRRARVKLAAIDQWDLDHADAEEPGDVPDCPYAKQHRFAENLERLLVAELGLTWAEHSRIIEAATSLMPVIVEPPRLTHVRDSDPIPADLDIP